MEVGRLRSRKVVIKIAQGGGHLQAEDPVSAWQRERQRQVAEGHAAARVLLAVARAVARAVLPRRQSAAAQPVAVLPHARPHVEETRRLASAAAAAAAAAAPATRQRRRERQCVGCEQ